MPSPTVDEIKTLFAVHHGAEAVAERAARALDLDTTRSWVDPNGHRLSDRVWLAKAEIRTAIDEVIREAVRTGADPLKVAVALESYLTPENRPIRDPATGRLIR